MPKEGFTPEIRTAMATSKPGRINASPRKENSGKTPIGVKNSAPAQPQEQMPKGMQRPNAVQRQTAPGVVHSMPPDAPHIAAATSIAHAILARRGGP